MLMLILLYRMLSKGYNVLRPEGYGNLFEMLLNKASAYYPVELNATFHSYRYSGNLLKIVDLKKSAS